MKPEMPKSMTIDWKIVSKTRWLGKVKFDPSGLKPCIITECFLVSVPNTDVVDLELRINARVSE